MGEPLNFYDPPTSKEQRWPGETCKIDGQRASVKVIDLRNNDQTFLCDECFDVFNLPKPKYFGSK